MSTFGVISDVHCHDWSAFSTILKSGVNSRYQSILDELNLCALRTKAAGGLRMYITGDLFHVRGSVSPTVLNPLIDVMNAITSSGVDVRILAGNHDLESRDSSKLGNACEALSPIAGVSVVSKTSVFYDDNVVMVPWFDKLDDVRKQIKNAIEEIDSLGDDAANYTLMLHAPLNSVLLGIPDHGFYAKELAAFGFKRVFCGHYHNHKKFEGEVYSVGATTHQTWGDVGTVAGHMIASDVDVRHYNPKAPSFIDYDLGWDDDTAAEKVTGNFVRLTLGEATEEEIDMMKDHIGGLGAKGVVVNAIPVPKGTATTRTTGTVKAPTVRESIASWVDANVTTNKTAVEALCAKIMDEVEAVEV